MLPKSRILTNGRSRRHRPRGVVPRSRNRQATSAALLASTMADLCQWWAFGCADAPSQVRCDAFEYGWGSLPREMSIDSLVPFCYSTQFARCAGNLLGLSGLGGVAVAFRGR